MTNLLKISARRKVGNLIKSGKLLRNPYCLRCFRKCFADAHHPDYSKPLLIEWLCHECHDKEHYKTRYDLVQKRRKIFDPCVCGKKAVCRNMCKACYANWRAIGMKAKCIISDCERTQHTRGLCNKHKQNKILMSEYGLVKAKPGTKPMFKISS